MAKNCKCITRMEECLTEVMKESYHNGEVIDKVEFKYKSNIYHNNCLQLVLCNPTKGKVRDGKRIRCFTAEIVPKFCPFCGKPVFDEIEEKGGKQ